MMYVGARHFVPATIKHYAYSVVLGKHDASDVYITCDAKYFLRPDIVKQVFSSYEHNI